MEKVTGSENRGPLSELETEAEAEEEEPGAAALEDPGGTAGEQACCQDGDTNKCDAPYENVFSYRFHPSFSK